MLDKDLDPKLQFIAGDRKLEQMADKVHQVWCNWMKEVFSQGTLYPKMPGKGLWVMSLPAQRRWTKQMTIPYAQLSESEKNSDREIARRYLDIALLKE